MVGRTHLSVLSSVLLARPAFGFSLAIAEKQMLVSADI